MADPMTTDTAALVARLRELAEDVSPAPWVAPESSDGDVWDTLTNGEPGIPLLRSERGDYRSWGRALSNEERTLNAVFVAELRNALPQILSALESLSAPAPDGEVEAVARAISKARVDDGDFWRQYEEAARAAIAALPRRDEAARMREAIFWACGAHGDFPGSGDPSLGKFFWRKELRERAGISDAELNARAALKGEA